MTCTLHSSAGTVCESTTYWCLGRCTRGQLVELCDSLYGYSGDYRAFDRFVEVFAGGFTGFAPFNDPDVVVTVYFDLGVGGDKAAPVAGKIIKYFEENVKH